MESDGIIEACVELSGVLERDVTISLSTSDGSAVGKFHMATIVSAISKSQHCSFHLLSYIHQDISNTCCRQVCIHSSC